MPFTRRFLALRFSSTLPSSFAFSNNHFPISFSLSLSLQVTVDVAWSPECIDLRCYDYPGLPQYLLLALLFSFSLFHFLSLIFLSLSISLSSFLLSFIDLLFHFLSLPLSHSTSGLAFASDFLMIMGYALRSQVFEGLLSH